VLSGARNVTVQDNAVDDAWRADGSIAASASSVTLRRNLITQGVLVVGGGEALVTGNFVAGDVLAHANGTLRVEDNLVHGVVSVSAAPGSVAVARGNHVRGGLHVGAFVDGRSFGTVLAESNRVDGNGFACLGALGGAVLRGNQVAGCSLQAPAYHGAVVEPSNLVDGRPTLQLRDVRDATLDLAATPLGWLQVVGARNATLRGADVRADRVELLALDGVVLEDARLPETALEGRDVTLRRVAAPALSATVQGAIEVEDSTFDGGHVAGCRAAVMASFVGNGSLGLHNVTARRCEAGVVLGLFGSESSPFPRVPVVIDQRSRIVENTVGVRVHQPGNAPGVRIVDATIDDNSHLDVRVPDGLVDARGVWWGSPAGPSPGRISTEHGVVLVDPWLTSPP
ncbi:MAG TPA: right-handed parallel beta-helix repeat-containing protein, partial [Candidatus Thermoplasmatota archaeon]|nr:right-handed parallel beta-helix repeat-containing protein [Candidatus Thermoplasmatota archaeon]